MRVDLRLWLAVVAVIFTVAVLAGMGWDKNPEHKPPDVFSQGGITVATGETIGRLMVVDGDAVIAGRVTGWLAVVGGSVDMRPGGFVDGLVLVLGGKIRGNAGGAPFTAVLPPESPLVGGLLVMLAATLFAGVLIGALLLWLLSRWLRRTRWCCRVLDWLQGHRQRWPWLYAMAGLAVSGWLLALFVHLAEETIFEKEAELFDRVIIWLVRYFADPAVDVAMLSITALGSGYAYVVLAPIVLCWFWGRGSRREAITLAICLGGSAVLNYLLKHLFVRARPEMFRVISETGYSFPSGHAMVSLCFFGMVAYLISRRLPLARRMAVYFFAAVTVAAIGISRIYLGVHYPSDVAAGYFAGGTWLVFCVSLLWWWEIEKERGTPSP